MLPTQLYTIGVTMKRIATLLVVCILAMPAMAEDQSLGYEPYCGNIGQIAYFVMNARQSGESVSGLVDHITNKVKKRSLQKIMYQMVVDAYKTPRTRTEEKKDEIIKEFGTRYFLNCINAMNVSGDEYEVEPSIGILYENEHYEPIPNSV